MSGYAPESPTAGAATVTSNQGTPNTVANAWPVKVTDGVDTAAVTAALELNVLATAQPGVDIGDVTVNNGAGAAAVNIQDGGNSITVDGAVTASGTITANQGTPTVTANRWPVQISDGTDLALVTAAGELNVLATAQPGTDIGDVTINNAAGASAVNIQDGGNSITIDGTVTANAGTGDHIVVGNVAHDAVDSGNPVGIGLNARTTNPTAVADGDRVRATGDDLGRQAIVLSQVRDLVQQDAAITLSTTTETTLIAAGAAGVFHDLTLLMVTNTSATAVRVDFRDATAGTVRFSIAIAANGGAIIPFNVPWKQTTAANNWTAQLSAAVTDVRIAAQAVKNI